MKRALTGIAAAAVSLGTLAPAAFAATTASYTMSGANNITIDGKVVSSPIAIAATDSGTTTSYFPIWYLSQALNGAGYTCYSTCHFIWMDSFYKAITDVTIGYIGSVLGDVFGGGQVCSLFR